MIEKKNILVVGAGGFIGGHLVKKLLENNNSITATDIKPKQYWFQDYDEVQNYYSMDMKDINNCRKVTKNIDYVLIWLAIWVVWVLLKIIKLNVCNLC